ncbi:MAG: MBL fold metallo-hydrolase, partial [Clostridium sp.]
KELDSNCYIPAHHPKYNKETFNEFYNYQRLLGDIVGEGISLEEAKERFKEKLNREAKDEEVEDLKVFINNNKKKN